jgi:chitinase
MYDYNVGDSEFSTDPNTTFWFEQGDHSDVHFNEVPYEALTEILFFHVAVNWGEGDANREVLQPDHGINDHMNYNVVRVQQAVKDAHDAGIPIFLTIGGANDGRFRTVLEHEDQSVRDQFVQDCVDLVNNWGFDGIDLNYEEEQIQSAADGLVYIISNLRQEFDNIGSTGFVDSPRIYLTMFPNYGSDFMNTIVDNMDDIDLLQEMTYDFGGYWKDWVMVHNSGTYSNDEEGNELFFPNTSIRIPSADRQLNQLLDNYPNFDLSKYSIGMTPMAWEWYSLEDPGGYDYMWPPDGQTDSNEEASFSQNRAGRNSHMNVNREKFFERWDVQSGDDPVDDPRVIYDATNGGYILQIEPDDPDNPGTAFVDHGGERNVFRIGVFFEGRQAYALKKSFIDENGINGAVIWDVLGGYEGNGEFPLIVAMSEEFGVEKEDPEPPPNGRKIDPEHPMAKKLMLYFQFDEGEGDTISDISDSENVHNGTATGGEWATLDGDPAFRLRPNETDYITVPDHDEIGVPDEQDFSFGFFFAYDGAGTFDRNRFIHKSFFPGYYLEDMNWDNNWEFAITNNTMVEEITGIDDGNVHQVVLVVDQKNLEVHFYVDGVFVGTGTYDSNNSSNTGEDLELGYSNPPDNSYEITFLRFGFWNRQLTPDEVSDWWSDRDLMLLAEDQGLMLAED